MKRYCVVCASETPYRKTFVKNGKDYLKCPKCKLIIVDPLPSLEEMRDYYDADYEVEEGMGTARADAEFLFQATARSRIPQVRPYAKSGRWLDVGCANGAFLEIIADLGYDTHGIDLSENAVAIAKSKNLNARAATIQDCRSDASYDLVSAFDVIEHVLNPESFVEAANSLLSLGGIFLVTTPDTQSIMARIMGPRWYEYIPETHFFNFNRKNLAALLQRSGFEIIRTKRAKKHLNFNYSQIQFKAYNPLIHRILGVIGHLLPRKAKEFPVSFYIGELFMIARKTADLSSVRAVREPDDLNS